MAKFTFYALWLSLICIIVFIFQSIIPSATDALLLNQNAVSGFEIWRFLTAIFVHGGIIHLMYNIFALALFGSMLEKFVGSRRFLLVFFLSGIIANIVSVNFYTSSLGASGAIYGILGNLVVLKPLMMVWAFGFPMPMFIAGIIWVAAGIFGIFVPTDNTGYIAHLSGIVVGFLLGVIFRLTSGKTRQLQNKMQINDNDMHRWEQSYILRR